MMKHILLVALMLPIMAHATNTQNGSIHHNYVNVPSLPSTSESVSSSAANASSKATAGSTAAASGGTGTGGAASYNGGSSGFYVLPPPVAATPLPTGVCPQGDSYSWSVGWNFFSYAESKTRTEMECLEKTLAYLRATIPPVVQPRLDPVEHIHPVCTVQPQKQVFVNKKKTVVPAKKVCN